MPPPAPPSQRPATPRDNKGNDAATEAAEAPSLSSSLLRPLLAVAVAVWALQSVEISAEVAETTLIGAWARLAGISMLSLGCLGCSSQCGMGTTKNWMGRSWVGGSAQYTNKHLYGRVHVLSDRRHYHRQVAP